MTTRFPGRSAYEDHALTARARAVMAGGNTRSTVYVPPAPPYAVAGSGCYVDDQFGHRLLDCNNNYTSLLHGHAHPRITRAAKAALEHGSAFGLPTESEIALAERLVTRTGMAKWRFSNSGTEAVMTALRGARAYTGRDLIIRFEGSYHGTADAVVDGTAPGIPPTAALSSLALPQGDRGALDRAIRQHRDSIAGILIDLMPNRAGLVAADGDFVRHVRQTATDVGALLIVDEVITFRLATGGFHKIYGIEPDLITVGKIVGGGFPIGAAGGRADVMGVFDPGQAGGVGWGGTFSANPVSMTAGAEALDLYGPEDVARLNDLGNAVRTELLCLGVRVTGDGSLIRIRESVDPTALWWSLYERGVLAGTNGLLALSTPMGDVEAGCLVDSVAETVAGLRT